MILFSSCRKAVWTGTALLLIAAAPQPQQKPAPRPVAVAETKLLMEGLNQPNFKGLERLLKERPADDEAWTFARGQALLIAETSNLLMLRPPRNQGRETWMDNCADLRFEATRLSRAAANRDYDLSRSVLTDVANACNRCHQNFRVQARFKPFAR